MAYLNQDPWRVGLRDRPSREDVAIQAERLPAKLPSFTHPSIEVLSKKIGWGKRPENTDLYAQADQAD